MSKEKNKRNDFVDDGSTIADMNVEGFRWYQSKKTQQLKKNLVEVDLSPKERRAIVKGAFLAFLPVFLVIVGSFIAVYLLFLYFAATR